MTTATALIALLPVLTSTGKGLKIIKPNGYPHIWWNVDTIHDHVCGACISNVGGERAIRKRTSNRKIKKEIKWKIKLKISVV